jgi:hypothetical protein
VPVVPAAYSPPVRPAQERPTVPLVPAAYSPPPPVPPPPPRSFGEPMGVAEVTERPSQAAETPMMAKPAVQYIDPAAARPIRWGGRHDAAQPGEPAPAPGGPRPIPNPNGQIPPAPAPVSPGPIQAEIVNQGQDRESVFDASMLDELREAVAAARTDEKPDESQAGLSARPLRTPAPEITRIRVEPQPTEVEYQQASPWWSAAPAAAAEARPPHPDHQELAKHLTVMKAAEPKPVDGTPKLSWLDE